ncbi:MAG: glycosyltransferase [Betaproteobacteria bacterium]
MSSSADVDIVIVNYCCAGDTLEAVSLLAPWRFNILWIIDNSDDTVEAETLREGTAHLPWVRLIVAERNLGFGRACNLAFDRSRAPFFLLLNPDARIAPDAIALLADALGDGWAGVSPRTYWDAQQRFLLPTASIQSPATLLAAAALTRSPRLAHVIFRRYLGRMQKLMAATAPFPVDFVAGAILMLRRQAVLRAGGLFDPDYFMFFEDSELSLRLRRKGFRLGLVPLASAIHEYRHKALKAPLMTASRQIYFRKCFPLFFRVSSELSRVDRIIANIDWTQWSKALSKPLDSADQFHANCPGSGVVALSPSPLLMPAMFRPADTAPARLADSDWELLEPGHYMAAMSTGVADAPLSFVSFERAHPRQ